MLAQASAADLSVHQSQLRSWVKALAGDPQHAFPGQGQMKPEQLEIAQLNPAEGRTRHPKKLSRAVALLRGAETA